MSVGKMKPEMDRWFGAALAVMQKMYWTVVVKRHLSKKAKLLIYQMIFQPSPTSMRFG